MEYRAIDTTGGETVGRFTIATRSGSIWGTARQDGSIVIKKSTVRRSPYRFTTGLLLVVGGNAIAPAQETEAEIVYRPTEGQCGC